MSPAKRLIRLSALLGLTPLLSCVSNLEPLNVTEFLPISGQNGACVAATSSTGGLAGGTLDTALPAAEGFSGLQPGYMVGVQLTSELTVNNVQPSNLAQANPNMLRTDTHTAELTSLSAKYQFVSQDGSVVQIPDRTFPVSVIVPTNGSTTFPVQVLSGADGQRLGSHAGKLVVEMTFSGALADGSSISSTPADFEIDVCSNCAHPTPCPMGQKLALTCGPDAAAQADGYACVTTGG